MFFSSAHMHWQWLCAFSSAHMQIKSCKLHWISAVWWKSSNMLSLHGDCLLAHIVLDQFVDIEIYKPWQPHTDQKVPVLQLFCLRRLLWSSAGTWLLGEAGLVQMTYGVCVIYLFGISDSITSTMYTWICVKFQEWRVVLHWITKKSFGSERVKLR